MLTQVVFPSRIPVPQGSRGMGKVLIATPVSRSDWYIPLYHSCRIFNETNL